jgi:hypothetical protein
VILSKAPPEAGPRCECTDLAGPDGCHAQAIWLVAVGSRQSDAQRSCGRHLNRTCWLMTGGEGDRHVTLSVTMVQANS